VTIAASSARPTLPQSNTHAAFPGLCSLPGGDLLAVWREGPSHTGGSNGVIRGRRLSRTLAPQGEAWSIADWDRDLRDPSVTLLADGRIAVTMFSYNTPSDPACQAWVGYSQDEGVSVGEWEQIDPGAPLLAISSPVVQLTDGTLVALAYGRRTDADMRDGASCYRKPPGGTWKYAATIAADGVRDYQEPTAIQLRNGALLYACRYGNNDRIALGASHDGGRTWTAPVPKFTGWGRPSLVELSTGPTVCVYREPGAAPHHAVMRVSPDRGGRWGAQRLLATARAQMAYAALVETGAGLVAGLLALEDSATNSRVTSLHLVDVD
jgi:BNR repeat protein